MNKKADILKRVCGVQTYPELELPRAKRYGSQESMGAIYDFRSPLSMTVYEFTISPERDEKSEYIFGGQEPQKEAFMDNTMEKTNENIEEGFDSSILKETSAAVDQANAEKEEREKKASAIISEYAARLIQIDGKPVDLTPLTTSYIVYDSNGVPAVDEKGEIVKTTHLSLRVKEVMARLMWPNHLCAVKENGWEVFFDKESGQTPWVRATAELYKDVADARPVAIGYSKITVIDTNDYNKPNNDGTYEQRSDLECCLEEAKALAIGGARADAYEKAGIGLAYSLDVDEQALSDAMRAAAHTSVKPMKETISSTDSAVQGQSAEATFVPLATTEPEMATETKPVVAATKAKTRRSNIKIAMDENSNLEDLRENRIKPCLQAIVEAGEEVENNPSLMPLADEWNKKTEEIQNRLSTPSAQKEASEKGFMFVARKFEKVCADLMNEIAANMNASTTADLDATPVSEKETTLVSEEETTPVADIEQTELFGEETMELEKAREVVFRGNKLKDFVVAPNRTMISKLWRYADEETLAAIKVVVKASGDEKLIAACEANGMFA